MITFCDLFAGIGGIKLGLEKTNKFSCQFANDMDKPSSIIYKNNHNCPYFLDDFRSLKHKPIPKIDMICGGFPCQPFSIAGYQKGIEDDRGSLIFDIFDFAVKNNVPYLLLENVKNLYSHDKGKTFQLIKDLADINGYTISYKIYNTYKATGIPQNRERLIMFFSLKTKNIEYIFPDFNVPLKNVFDFIEKDKVADKYYYKETSKIYEFIKDIEHISTNKVYQWRRTYVRCNQSSVCPTLTKNMGTGGHNVPIIKDDYGIRKLTPRECLNLQGFPESFDISMGKDADLYCMAGNSVTVELFRLIGEDLRKYLK